MHYLIDGHNVIAAMTSISLEDPNDEVKLVILLRRWTAAVKSRRCTVYFDRGLPGGLDKGHTSSKVKVIFASRGTADDAIIRRIKRTNNRVEYILVSSDRVVKDAAAAAGLKTYPAQKLALELDQLNAISPSEKEGAESGREDVVLNDQEIQEWLRLFKGEDNTED